MSTIKDNQITTVLNVKSRWDIFNIDYNDLPKGDLYIKDSDGKWFMTNRDHIKRCKTLNNEQVFDNIIKDGT